MMMNRFKLLYEQMQNGNYSLVNPDYPHKVFFGRDMEGRAVLALHLKSQTESLPNLRSIKCAFGFSQDPQFPHMVSLHLIDSKLIDIFISLAVDLVAQLAESHTDKLHEVFPQRIVLWQRIFQNAPTELLSEQELMGLFGELLYLKKLCPKMNNDYRRVIEGWTGPANEPQDFTFADIRYEVKTILETRTELEISSAEQLDVSNAMLHLVSVMVKKSEDGKSVNDLYTEITQLIRDQPLAQNAFLQRLSLTGYVPREEYGILRFSISKIITFDVIPSFPAIRRSQLSSGIDRVRYTLSLDVIKPFSMEG
jgi:hypothetical protein